MVAGQGILDYPASGGLRCFQTVPNSLFFDFLGAKIGFDWEAVSSSCESGWSRTLLKSVANQQVPMHL